MCLMRRVNLPSDQWSACVLASRNVNYMLHAALSGNMQALKLVIEQKELIQDPEVVIKVLEMLSIMVRITILIDVLL